MSLNYFDVLLCDFFPCDLCLCLYCCILFFYLTRSALQVHLQAFSWVMSNISKIDNLVICSLNVRGLPNKIKGRETFNWLRNKKYSVYFLQEVHSSKEIEEPWLAEWGYRGLFSGLSSARAGVSILFNNNFSFEIQKYFSDPEGRFITVDIKTEDKILTL